MTRQRDASLDRVKAARSELCVSGAEGFAAGAQPPCDSIKALRCSGRPWRLIRPRRVIVED